jgi:hypothetical protein
VTKQGSADVDGQSAVDQLGSEQTSVQSIAGLVQSRGQAYRWGFRSTFRRLFPSPSPPSTA